MHYYVSRLRNENASAFYSYATQNIDRQTRLTIYIPQAKLGAFYYISERDLRSAEHMYF